MSKTWWHNPRVAFYFCAAASRGVVDAANGLFLAMRTCFSKGFQKYTRPLCVATKEKHFALQCFECSMQCGLITDSLLTALQARYVVPGGTAARAADMVTIIYLKPMVSHRGWSGTLGQEPMDETLWPQTARQLLQRLLGSFDLFGKSFANPNIAARQDQNLCGQKRNPCRAATKGAKRVLALFLATKKTQTHKE